MPPSSQTTPKHAERGKVGSCCKAPQRDDRPTRWSAECLLVTTPPTPPPPTPTPTPTTTTSTATATATATTTTTNYYSVICFPSRIGKYLVSIISLITRNLGHRMGSKSKKANLFALLHFHFPDSSSECSESPTSIYARLGSNYPYPIHPYPLYLEFRKCTIKGPASSGMVVILRLDSTHLDLKMNTV